MLLIFTCSLSLVLTGGKPPIEIFKKKGLTGSQFLEGVTFSRGGGGFSFYIKINQNLKYLTKKVYKQKCFSVITKNLT